MKGIPLSQTVHKAKHTSGWSNISYTETALCVSVVWTYTEGDGLDREKEVVAELLHVRALSQSQARGVWLLAWFMMLHVFFSSSSPCSPSDLSLRAETKIAPTVLGLSL